MIKWLECQPYEERSSDLCASSLEKRRLLGRGGMMEHFRRLIGFYKEGEPLFSLAAEGRIRSDGF